MLMPADAADAAAIIATPCFIFFYALLRFFWRHYAAP